MRGVQHKKRVYSEVVSTFQKREKTCWEHTQ